MPQHQPVLSSDRLVFRVPGESDFEDLLALDSDAEVRGHFPDGVLSADRVRERIANNQAMFDRLGYCDFVLTDKTSGAFVGRAGFAPFDGDEIEAGYVLRKASWGKGLAQEALRALLGWARESLQADRIIAYAPQTHAASLNVMQKCGMQFLKNDERRGTSCVFYQYPLA